MPIVAGGGVHLGACIRFELLPPSTDVLSTAEWIDSSTYLVDAVGKRESVEVLPCWHEVVTKHGGNVVIVVVGLAEVSIEGSLAELHGNRSHYHVH